MGDGGRYFSKAGINPSYIENHKANTQNLIVNHKNATHVIKVFQYLIKKKIKEYGYI